MGKLNEALLRELLDEPFCRLSAPKSSGRELFNLSWLEAKIEKTRKQSSALSSPIAAQDVQATLVEFTVRTIADNLKNIDTPLVKRLLVCGGGVKNRLMMQRLAEHLTQWQISTTRDFGLDPDYVEAAAFAWLAYRRMHNQSGNVPEVTGAQKAISLGAIFPKP